MDVEMSEDDEGEKVKGLENYKSPIVIGRDENGEWRVLEDWTPVPDEVLKEHGLDYTPRGWSW